MAYFLTVFKSSLHIEKTNIVVNTTKNNPAINARLLKDSMPIPAKVTAETKLIKDKIVFIFLNFVVKLCLLSLPR